MLRSLQKLCACAVVAAVLSVPGAAHHKDNGRHVAFGPWTAAVNLGPIVNSTFAEAGPGISSDGLSLYFHSGRHSSGGETDLYVTRRAAIDLPWETPVNLGTAVNSTAPEVVPMITPDGRHLFFASLRSGNYDIYVSERTDIHDDLSWGPAVALPSPVNGPSWDAGPAYFGRRDGRPELYFSSDRGNGLGQPGLDIYRSELQPDGWWTTPVYVSEINSAFQDGRAVIRGDGLELVLTSTRDGGQDLYSSHRDHVWEPWSTPERIGLPVSTDASEVQATFSWNGRTLYFGSTRLGGSGNFDLYAATRAPLPKKSR